jgi:hypothetical protein
MYELGSKMPSNWSFNSDVHAPHGRRLTLALGHMKQALSPQQINEQVSALANALLNGRGRLLESIRSLSALRFDISADGHDPDFQIFLAIDSETDHLPSSSAMPQCSEAWLAKCAQEEQEIAKFYELDIQLACKRLLKRFGA